MQGACVMCGEISTSLLTSFFRASDHLCIMIVAFASHGVESNMKVPFGGGIFIVVYSATEIAALCCVRIQVTSSNFGKSTRRQFNAIVESFWCWFGAISANQCWGKHIGHNPGGYYGLLYIYCRRCPVLTSYQMQGQEEEAEARL